MVKYINSITNAITELTKRTVGNIHCNTIESVAKKIKIKIGTLLTKGTFLGF